MRTMLLAAAATAFLTAGFCATPASAITLQGAGALKAAAGAVDVADQVGCWGYGCGYYRPRYYGYGYGYRPYYRPYYGPRPYYGYSYGYRPYGYGYGYRPSYYGYGYGGPYMRPHYYYVGPYVGAF